MPAGMYRVMDGEGNPRGTERFRCAPGPAGWRYFSEIETRDPVPHRETVDLTVDSGWRPVRLRVDTGEHALQAVPQGDRLAVVLDDRELSLDWGPEVEFDYFSPCFNAVTANRLGDAGAEIAVAWFDPYTCEPRGMRQRYERLEEGSVTTPVGTFDAVRWRYSSIPDAFTRDIWVAGDLVVDYPGVFELIEYEPGAHGAVAHA
jgi:hypothetical protein